ncbi:YeaC family protein [Candidatus Sororendozoicomonas aggregata]|uniref:YeaC family protein n=1 Tax=Candidatus Sororendozoicomonas aggregata TaxID=3073239 RepID=UPI002ECFCB81
MNIDDLIERMTPAIYQNLRQSLERGKWPNGVALTQEQRDITLRALIVYEYKYVEASERIGYMPQQCKGMTPETADTSDTIIRFKD